MDRIIKEAVHLDISAGIKHNFMKKTILFNVFFSLIGIYLRAQSFMVLGNRDTIVLVHLNRGDSLLKIGEPRMAIEEYRKQNIILQEYQKQYGDLSPMVTYNFACAFSRDNQPDSAFKYLNESMKYDSTATALVNPDFLALRKDKPWDDFENKLISEIMIAHPNQIKDLPLAKKLWDMGACDQYYYYEIEIVQNKIGMNSPVETAIWDSKNKMNLENERELDSIINIKGWPKISQVGSTATGVAFLIIQHSTLEKQEKYLPIIKKLCEQGEANWSDYAYMYDRIQVSENKKQLYGSQLKYNDETKQYELYPIEDEKNVDKRRAEMGLRSLSKYVVMWGIIYVPKK